LNIVIPIKQVPETSNVKMDEETGTMKRDGVESIINPLDLYAIETGIQLKEEYGGGSLTALPIIETKAGDVSAYIPTNVISITDGQIYLESELFYSGVRPAINVGISVSRVGGDAQIKAMKDVAGTLRLDLSQYRELEAFAQFGSDLDESTQQKLNRGERIVESLKQAENSPMVIQDQVISIYAVVNGYLDDIPVDNVSRFEDELLNFMNSNYPELGDKIVEVGKLTDEIEEELEKGIEEFKETFSVKKKSILSDQGAEVEEGEDEEFEELETDEE